MNLQISTISAGLWITSINILKTLQV